MILTLEVVTNVCRYQAKFESYEHVIFAVATHVHDKEIFGDTCTTLVVTHLLNFGDNFQRFRKIYLCDMFSPSEC